MKSTFHSIAFKAKGNLLAFGLVTLFLLAGTIESSAQDDKPAKARRERIKQSKPKGERTARRNPRVRETRFKMRTKKGDRPETRSITGRRIRRNERSKGPRVDYSNYKPASRRTEYRSKARFSSAPQRIRTATRKGERARTGDISGRQLRTQRSSQPDHRTRNYNARNPFVVKKGKPREGRNSYSAPSIRSITASEARRRNVTSGRAAKSPRTTGGNILSRKSSSGKVRTTRTKPGDRAQSFERNQRTVKSISGNIRNRRPVNPYARANVRRSRKGDVARTRDITGRRVRENKRSPRRSITSSAPSPYLGSRKKGERATSNRRQLSRANRSIKPGGRFANTSFGGVRTASRSGETATNRSASGKNIRTKNMRSRRPFMGTRQYPGHLTATKRGEGGFVGKAGKIRSSTRPGERAGVQFGGFRTATAKGERSTNRDIAGRRIRTKNKESRKTQIVGLPQKRRLSRSGELMNNDGKSLGSRPPGKGTIAGGTFGGNLKAKKGPASGPGSKFGGNIRAIRPPKGGGSITRLRNNKGNPLGTRKPGKGTLAGGRYAGDIKKGPSTKPGKGTIQGGNFRGRQRGKIGFYPTGKDYGFLTARERLHNNKGRALDQRAVGRGTVQGAGYRGNISGRKSMKPGKGAIAGSRYTGTIRKGPPTKPGRGTIQGGNYRGSLRTKKGYYTTERTYAIQTQRDERLHNNKGRPLDGRKVGRGTIQGATYRGDLRARRAPDKPGKGTIAGFKNRGELRAGAIKPKLQPQGQTYRGNLRLARGYEHQKAGDALKKQRAWYQIGAIRADKYSGYYRYRSPSRKDKHISSAFTGFNPGNAKKENERFFKFKIWFARLFRNETPRHMKNRGKKPRYDRGESEIWYR